jgi:hypothetical protein
VWEHESISTTNDHCSNGPQGIVAMAKCPWLLPHRYSAPTVATGTTLSITTVWTTNDELRDVNCPSLVVHTVVMDD